MILASLALAVACETQTKPVDLPPKGSGRSSDGASDSARTRPPVKSPEGRERPGRSGAGEDGKSTSPPARRTGDGAKPSGSSSVRDADPVGADGAWGGSRSRSEAEGSRAAKSAEDRRSTNRARAAEKDSPAARPSKPRRAGLDGMGTPRRIQGPTASTWSIVLGTFTGPDHAGAAQDACTRLGERIPEFAGARVRSTPSGSMILWGQFAGPDDPASQRELKRIQQYEYRGARPFATAILSRPETTRKPPTGAADLRNLRARFPNVDPLYTLQVAAWADFDGTMTLEEIRRGAEGYAAELRARGFDAWYNHDDDLMMSVVTIGAFDRTAYDSQSTLYSAEVAKLLKQFPEHLVNGEPLLIRSDPRNPRSPEAPQPCMLVEVPR